MKKRLRKNLDLTITAITVFSVMYAVGYYFRDSTKEYDDRFWCNRYVSRMKSDGTITDNISGLCENKCFSSTLVELADGRRDLIDAYRLAREKCR